MEWFTYLATSLSLFTVVSSNGATDTITVHNMTPRDLYVGLYYLRGDSAERVGAVQLLDDQQTGVFTRPSRRLFYDRELAFSEDEMRLPDRLTKRELEKLHSKNVGILQGDVFYIADQEAEFHGYSSLEWNYIKPLVDATYKALFNQLHAVKANPYKNKFAMVRVGNELSPLEKRYLQKRMPRVQEGLEELLGEPLTDKYIPKIAFVCSGGGYRAMLFACGALLGAAESRVFDATTYLVGLSGSTWAIGTMMSLGLHPATLPDYLVAQTQKGISSISIEGASLIANMLLVKYLYSQPINAVDLYGGLLANVLFEKRSFARQEVHLSEQSLRISDGQLPLPIYTAVRGEDLSVENQWYEFTPYEVGGSWLGMYVPTWAFGRKFKDGTSLNQSPEQSFGFLLATYGLAIGVTLQRALEEAQLENKINNPMATSVINHVMSEYGETRAIWSRVFNFTAGMPKSPIKNQRTLKIVDAGISFNLPYPPISGERPERKADIIICVDASGGLVGGELKKTEAYAREKGLKFPRIDYERAARNAVTVFADEDPNVPTLIYIARIKDQALIDSTADAADLQVYRQLLLDFDVEQCISKEACNTFNFSYTQKESRSLISLGAFNLKAEIETIKDAIKSVIERKTIVKE